MTSRRAGVLAVLSLLAATATVPVTAATAAAAPAPIDSLSTAPASAGGAERLIVRYVTGTDPRRAAAALGRHGIRRHRPLPALGMGVVEVPPGRSAADVDRALSEDPAVAYVEPDSRITAATSDPYWWRQWGLHNTGQTVDGKTATPDVDVNAPEGWALAAGRPRTSTVVAVIDGGIDMSHPDLAPHAWRNPGEIAGNGVDDDGSGRVDDVAGWDFVSEDATVFDAEDDGHGTHVAGIVAASTDNGIGVAGVAGPGNDVRILPVKVLGPEGGDVSDAVSGIEYAASMGARVINASWGGPMPSRALRDAISASGAVFVTASGNGGADGVGDDNDVVPTYPANERLPNLLSVTAVDSTGARAGFANYGATTVHLGAPGASILSAFPGGYRYVDGTSMAAPHVAGAAALLASLRPDRTAADLAGVLKATTRPLEALRRRTVTGGMLDVERAVAEVLGTPVPPPSEEPPPVPTVPGLAACPETVLEEPVAGRFPDVQIGSVHQVAIDCAAWWGWVNGLTDGTFAPATSVTRGQAASFLARLLDDAGRLPATAPDRFDDDAGSAHEASINALAELGVVNGSGPRSFNPDASVSRAQLTTLLVNLAELVLETTLPTGPTPFLDISGSFHQRNIEKAYLADLTGGTTANTFSPSANVTRAQAASFVVRLASSFASASRLTVPG